ncbi:alpha/beta fold hydrolase [Angustibacter luteus]|uniref:Alpha/beta fold hydrolase n=1 Tax=Angustibacter luteus TaxID=658456 RepID=A0ABW1JJY4_9ACTN
MSDLLAHDVAGDGEAVLLLHSGAADRRQWDGQWAALTARHRVVRPDLRGFGETPPPPEPGWSDSADLLALLDALGIERVAVVGSSYGGRIALELATVAPQRVSQLLLLCAAYPGVQRTPAVEAFGEAEDALLEAGDVEAAVALNVQTWLGPDATPAARDALGEMQRRTFEIQLVADDDLDPVRPDVDAATIEVPTVAFSGGQDLDLFQDVARHLADVMPHARLVELAWAGHLPGLERPEQTGYLLLAELAAPAEPADGKA